MEHGVRYEIGDDGVATLTLDRPDKRNAVMPPDWRALEDRLDDGSADPNVRVFVLTGQGSMFCSGGDLKSMGERLAQSPVRRSREMLRMTRAIQRFRETPKPIIGAVNGPAIGAGCVIALACDVRLATASAGLHHVCEPRGWRLRHFEDEHIGVGFGLHIFMPAAARSARTCRA